MPATLEGVRAKIIRANDHIEDTKRRIDAFSANPYDVLAYHDKQTDEWELRLQNVKQVPGDLGVPIGDAVHNLRAALDHLIYQLVLLNRQTPNKRTQFPIFFDAEDYFCDSRAMRKGISLIHDASVEGLQPYHRVGDESNHPLWWLTELDNFDKHRLLLLCDVAIPRGSGGMGIQTMHDMDMHIIFIKTPIAKDGAVLSRFKLIPRSPNAKVQMRIDVPCEIRFAQGGPDCVVEKPVLNVLSAIFGYIQNDVLPKFAGVFP